MDSNLPEDSEGFKGSVEEAPADGGGGGTARELDLEAEPEDVTNSCNLAITPER